MVQSYLDDCYELNSEQDINCYYYPAEFVLVIERYENMKLFYESFKFNGKKVELTDEKFSAGDHQVTKGDILKKLHLTDPIITQFCMYSGCSRTEEYKNFYYSIQEDIQPLKKINICGLTPQCWAEEKLSLLKIDLLQSLEMDYVTSGPTLFSGHYLDFKEQNQQQFITAIENNNHCEARIALARGANANISTRHALPLMLACCHGDEDLVKLLVKIGGAEVNLSCCESNFKYCKQKALNLRHTPKTALDIIQARQKAQNEKEIETADKISAFLIKHGAKKYHPSQSMGSFWKYVDGAKESIHRCTGEYLRGTTNRKYPPPF